MILEKWMINNLQNFGNCIISEVFLKAHGKSKIIAEVKELGFEEVSIRGVRRYSKQNVHAYPNSEPIKVTVTYIIETKQMKKVKTHTEVKKMQKFHIGDKVEIIDGTLKGKMGTVEEVEKNDVGDYTYGIKVPSVYSYLGLTAKQTAQLRLEKAAGKKRGRPAKAKETSKVEQPKELTKEVVEMTEAEPTAAVDEAVEAVEEEVKVVDNPVETVDEVVDEPVAPPKSAYDQLMEVYDELCKKLNFVELSTFCDIVTNDMETSKYVLEQMYQMSIEQLAKIREEIA